MRRTWIAAALVALVAAPAALASPIHVQVDVKNMGSFVVELHDNTPLHRDNFLQYVTEGAYADSFIHRSDYENAVIQGGGFCFPDDYTIDYVPVHDPVPYEADLGDSNVKWTLGAARTSDPDSATSQWYINMEDNSAGFDHTATSYGYTVFGHVISGFDVVQAIYDLNVWDGTSIHGAFGTLPLHDTYTGGALYRSDFVELEGMSVLPTPEPATLALLGIGGFAMALVRRRR